MTLITDGATISKCPLTNYLVFVPDSGVIFQDYEDATELYQNGGVKNAEHVYLAGHESSMEESRR